MVNSILYSLIYFNMSYKAQILYSTGLQAPKTVDKFLVSIPGILDSPIRVFSTALPQKKRTELVVNVTGQPVILPGKSVVEGHWTCRVYESVEEDVATQIQELKRRIVTDPLGKVAGYSLFDIPLFVTDQFTGAIPTYWNTLIGAWLQSVDDLSLDWSSPNKPVAWNLKFCYSDIRRSYLDEQYPDWGRE